MDSAMNFVTNLLNVKIQTLKKGLLKIYQGSG